jgi:heme exporter protein C
MNIYKYASPAAFYPLAGKMIPWFAIPAALLFVAGLYVGFFVAPTDFQQGDAYRIMFIHVPAAWMGMLLYVLMAFYAGIGWAFNARLASMMASSIAITGALFTLIALVTGSLWGKPTWGTWWVWDARMTSTLIHWLHFVAIRHR